MKTRISVVFLLFLAVANQVLADVGEGMVIVPSQHSVAETMDKLESALAAKGMTVFARIDHAQGAGIAGIEMRPTQVLVFGNPKIGSPLMLCQPSIAIDLPQKMLVWQDSSGQVALAYNDPMYLAKRHGISEQAACYPILSKVSGALANFAAAASKTR